MKEDLGKLTGIEFTLNVPRDDPRTKKMKRGTEWGLVYGVNGDEKTYPVKIKSRYTLRNGSIRYKCDVQFQS